MHALIFTTLGTHIPRSRLASASAVLMVGGFVPYFDLESFCMTFLLTVVFAMAFTMWVLYLSVLPRITPRYVGWGVFKFLVTSRYVELSIGLSVSDIE